MEIQIADKNKQAVDKEDCYFGQHGELQTDIYPVFEIVDLI